MRHTKKLELSLFKSTTGELSPHKIDIIRKLCDAQYFIETGTYLGNTTKAMRKIFEHVISIELSEELFSAAKSRFKNDKGITLLQGNSAERIGDALKIVNQKTSIIWLDAHWSGGNTAKSTQNTPILQELIEIKNSENYNSIIIVDDISYFWQVKSGFKQHDSIGGYPSIPELIKALNAINPSYQIIINGELLFAIPSNLLEEIQISSLLLATTEMRVNEAPFKNLENLEETISNASGSEKQALLSLPEIFKDALEYGIGGYYCYWRGLIFEKQDDLKNARSDFSLARRCGISIPARSWE